jgi:hypothetical protein
MTESTAKKFSSNIFRTSPSAMPSIDPNQPRPALLTSTSMPPNRSSAARTASRTCSASVTSRDTTRTRSP